MSFGMTRCRTLTGSKLSRHSDRMNGQGHTSSWMNWCRFAFRCAVSARAAPWANSIKYHGDGDVGISRCAGDSREDLPRILPPALGFDQKRWIEDQSHAGGLSGARWLSMAASTSLAKSPSMTAVESSGKSAMHSEMVRRRGVGAWIMATGNLPLSITTSAPAPSARQHIGEVAGGFRFRDEDHMVSHGAVIPSFLLLGAARTKTSATCVRRFLCRKHLRPVTCHPILSATAKQPFEQT